MGCLVFSGEVSLLSSFLPDSADITLMQSQVIFDFGLAHTVVKQPEFFYPRSNARVARVMNGGHSSPYWIPVFTGMTNDNGRITL